MTPAIDFTVSLAALAAGHQVGDFWVQRDSDAVNKGLPGWKGRRACAAHVLTYTTTQAIALALASVVLSVTFTLPHLLAGLAVSAVTHYAADRRVLLRRLAIALGKGRHWDNGGQLAMDQAWHYGAIFIAALVIAGRWPS